MKKIAVSILLLAGMLCVFVLAMRLAEHEDPDPLWRYYFDREPYLSPRYIDDLCCHDGDQGDLVVAINVEMYQRSNRYYGEFQVKGSRVSIVPEDWLEIPAMWYEYVGKTPDGIYIVNRGRKGSQSILLVEFRYADDHYHEVAVRTDQKKLVIKKLGEIPLDNQWNGEVKLDGYTLSLGNLGDFQIERYRHLKLFFRRLWAGLKGSRPPSFLVESPPYISPKIIQDLVSWISDGGDQVVSINLTDAQRSNRYHISDLGNSTFAEDILSDSGFNPYPPYFSYVYCGSMNKGLKVVQTSENGGGSGHFKYLLLIDFERDYGMNVDWQHKTICQNKERLLIKKYREIGLGDRWGGDIKVEANTINIRTECCNGMLDSDLPWENELEVL